MIAALLALLSGLVAETGQAASRRGRLHELEGRLGLREAGPQGDPMFLRLLHVARTQGPGAFFLVMTWLTGTPFRSTLARSESEALDKALAPIAESPAWLPTDLSYAPLVPGMARALTLAFQGNVGDFDALGEQIGLRVERSVGGKKGAPFDVVGPALHRLRSTLTNVHEVDLPAPPDLRDWFVATRPDLGRMDLEEICQAVEDWHAEQFKASGLLASHGEVVHRWKDGWTVQKLTTRRQLEEEGDSLGHCVGGHGYPTAVREGRTAIFSLREPDNRPRVTIEASLDRNGDVRSIEQVKGANNDTPMEWEDRDLARRGWEFLVGELGLRHDQLGHEGRELELAKLIGGVTDAESARKALREHSAQLDPDHPTGQAILNAVEEQRNESGNTDLLDAWVELVEDGTTSFLPTVVANEVFWDVVQPRQWVPAPDAEQSPEYLAGKPGWPQRGEWKASPSPVPVWWHTSDAYAKEVWELELEYDDDTPSDVFFDIEDVQRLPRPGLWLRVRAHGLLHFEPEYSNSDGSWHAGLHLEFQVEKTDGTPVAKTDGFDTWTKLTPLKTIEHEVREGDRPPWPEPDTRPVVRTWHSARRDGNAVKAFFEFIDHGRALTRSTWEDWTTELKKTVGTMRAKLEMMASAGIFAPRQQVFYKTRFDPVLDGLDEHGDPTGETFHLSDFISGTSEFPFFSHLDETGKPRKDDLSTPEGQREAANLRASKAQLHWNWA